MKQIFLVVVSLVLAGCGARTSAQVDFQTSLKALCGKAFEGTIVSTDAADDAWRGQTIVMHVRDCDMTEVRIPLHVGDDRSRTWVIHREGPRLALHHDHRHEDGSPDAITDYGGMAGEDISGTRQEFPADEATKLVFDREGIPDSKQNTWAVEIDPGADLFAYEMSRPGRFFRIEFDTSRPVEPPPPPWGDDRSPP